MGRPKGAKSGYTHRTVQEKLDIINPVIILLKKTNLSFK